MVAERDPRCAACGVPSTWQIVRDPAAGWVWLDELGWMCPDCVKKSDENAQRLAQDIRPAGERAYDDLRYELHNTLDGVEVRRVKVVGRFANRAEARQYMIDTTAERAARDA
jgi:hypothetical protein